MNNWERMKAGRLYNADSKDLEQIQLPLPIWMGFAYSRS